MKAIKIAKTIVMAPAYGCIAASFGTQELIAKAIADVTGSNTAEEFGVISELFRKTAFDKMVGKN